MKKRMCVIFGAWLVAALAVSCGPVAGEESFEAKPVDGTPILFDEGMEFYNIEPSVVTDGDTKYVFYTVNGAPSGGKSSIAVRKASQKDGMWIYGEKTIVLLPSENSFDSESVSNADIIKGSFRYDGKDYGWLMAYQGRNTVDEKNHKIGFAVASDPTGEWTKVEGLQIESEFSAGYGVSQPSLINYDKQNKVVLFYSYDRVTYTGQALLELDASDLSAPVWGEENTLTTDGLKEGNDYVTFNDADFAYDDESGYLYVVRNYNPASTQGCKLNTAVQVNKILFSELLTSNAVWETVDEKVDWKDLLDPADKDSMGWSYVYSGSIQSDGYGYVTGAEQLELVLTVTSYDDSTFEYLYYQTLTEIGVAV